MDISTVVPHEIFEKKVNENFGKIILGISSKKMVELNQPYRDTIYTMPDGQCKFQISYAVANAAFDEIRKNKIESLTVIHRGMRIELIIKRKSQVKLLELANSINSKFK